MPAWRGAATRLRAARPDRGQKRDYALRGGGILGMFRPICAARQSIVCGAPSFRAGLRVWLHVWPSIDRGLP